MVRLHIQKKHWFDDSPWHRIYTLYFHCTLSLPSCDGKHSFKGLLTMLKGQSHVSSVLNDMGYDLELRFIENKKFQNLQQWANLKSWTHLKLKAEIKRTCERSPYLVLSTACPPGSSPTRRQPLGKQPKKVIEVKSNYKLCPVDLADYPVCWQIKIQMQISWVGWSTTVDLAQETKEQAKRCLHLG